MNAMQEPGDDLHPDDVAPTDRARLSVGDPVLRKTRLLSRQCTTCIFRGNPMHLAPGRLRELVAQARGAAEPVPCARLRSSRHRSRPRRARPIRRHRLP
jgi:hypothetical protein